MTDDPQKVKTYSRDRVLDRAYDLVYRGRNLEYDSPDINAKRIAKLWSVILNREVQPHEVALCLAALKITRLIHKNKLDSWADLAGYSEYGAIVDTREETNGST